GSGQLDVLAWLDHDQPVAFQPARGFAYGGQADTAMGGETGEGGLLAFVAEGTDRDQVVLACHRGHTRPIPTLYRGGRMGQTRSRYGAVLVYQPKVGSAAGVDARGLDLGGVPRKGGRSPERACDGRPGEAPGQHERSSCQRGWHGPGGVGEQPGADR